MPRFTLVPTSDALAVPPRQHARTRVSSGLGKARFAVVGLTGGQCSLCSQVGKQHKVDIVIQEDTILRHRRQRVYLCNATVCITELHARTHARTHKHTHTHTHTRTHTLTNTHTCTCTHSRQGNTILRHRSQRCQPRYPPVLSRGPGQCLPGRPHLLPCSDLPLPTAGSPPRTRMHVHMCAVAQPAAVRAVNPAGAS